MKQTHAHKFHIKTEVLARFYSQGLSATQIGEKVGMFKSSVSRRLKKLGVLLRKSDDYEGSKRYWLWKGNDYIDPVTRKRNQRKHQKWSRAVRIRDKFTCQDCGRKDIRLHAHHLVDLRECINSSLEFDVSNGITLCCKCHGFRHRHKEQGE